MVDNYSSWSSFFREIESTNKQFNSFGGEPSNKVKDTIMQYTDSIEKHLSTENEQESKNKIVNYLYMYKYFKDININGKYAPLLSKSYYNVEDKCLTCDTNVKIKNNNAKMICFPDKIEHLQCIVLSSCPKLSKGNFNHLKYVDNLSFINLPSLNLTNTNMENSRETQNSNMRENLNPNNKIGTSDNENENCFSELQTSESIYMNKVCVESLHFPKLEYVSSFVVENMDRLMHISLPKVNKIDKLYIKNCPKLTTLEISNIEEICCLVIENCESLKSLYLKKLENVRKILLIKNCNMLDMVELKSLKYGTMINFCMVNMLNKVSMPMLKYVKNSIEFDNANKLEYLEFNELLSVTFLKANKCKMLKSIKAPKLCKLVMGFAETNMELDFNLNKCNEMMHQLRCDSTCSQ